MEPPNFCDKPVSGSKGTFRNFVFTLNNYTELEVASISKYPEWVRYVAFGKEVAASGTPHLQGFVVTWQAVRITQFKLWIRRAHIEPMIKELHYSEEYCSKESALECFGSKPAQGRRTDIIGVKRRVDEGANMCDLMQDEQSFALVMRNERSMNKYCEMQRGKRMRAEGRRVPKVYIRVGPTRSGKSSYVYEKHGFENVYSVPDLTGKWFDNYLGERIVLFDDVEAGQVPPPSFFKRITDGYPIQVPFKGGFTWFRPEIIYFTSNSRPKEWWPDIKAPDWNACKERIDEVCLVYKDAPSEVVYARLQPSDGVQEEVFEEVRQEENALQEDGHEEQASVRSEGQESNS